MQLKNKYLIILILIFNISFIFSQNNELKIGDIAPEIKLPNPQGKTINLSDFKNKIVLIDFWATWCSPCVKEQSKLKDIYTKYKNLRYKNADGFEIFAVSFDNKKKNWQNAIKNLNINWTQVSDLKFWASPVAKDYFIQDIPYNIFIDGSGKIIAINLHEEKIDQFLDSLILK